MVKLIEVGFFASLSFLPGVVPEQPISTSPVKRRTQSLSALPKDGDKSSPGKVSFSFLAPTILKFLNVTLTEIRYQMSLSAHLVHSFRGRRTTSGDQ